MGILTDVSNFSNRIYFVEQKIVNKIFRIGYFTKKHYKNFSYSKFISGTKQIRIFNFAIAWRNNEN